MLVGDAPDARRRASTSPRSAGILLVLVGVYLAQLALRAGCRPTSWPASPSGPSTGCARTSTRSSAGCRCKYFDGHPRGDVLSRVTNDIDNIGQTLQQSLTQLITVAADRSSACSIMMLTISPLLAVDLAPRRARSRSSSRSSSPAARRSSSSPSGRRPARSTATSRRCTPGHAIVKVFGRQQEAIDDVRRGERAALRGELPGPVHLRASSSPR